MRCSKCHGLGRVMTREVQVTRGSGHTMTRELFSADPRVRPADLARGSVSLQTYSCLPEGHSRDPRVRPAGPNLCITCRFLPEGPSRADTPNFERTSQRVEQLYQASATRHTLLGELRVG